MRQGARRMLRMFASQSERMAVAGVAGAAEHGVDDEEQEDRHAAAKHDAGVARAVGDDVGAGAHQREEPWR